MSFTFLVQTMLNDAATRFGDPNKTRFSDSKLLDFYNDACEELTTRWQVLDQDATFNWTGGEDRYSYPDDCVQVREIQYSATPSDTNTYQEIEEIYEDEYRDLVFGNKPTGDDKLYYWPRLGFFLAWPKPITTVSQGGLMTYFKLADRQTTAITAVDGTGATYSRTMIELPNSLRGIIRDRMVIGMQVELGRIQEANVRRAEWEEQASRIVPRMEDRAQDKRPRFRPSSKLQWRAV